jgi:endonuclease YncB( thermonuclease family)
VLRQDILALASVALLWLAPTASAADLIGPTRIIDGDTIEIYGQHIRLALTAEHHWVMLNCRADFSLLMDA